MHDHVARMPPERDPVCADCGEKNNVNLCYRFKVHLYLCKGCEAEQTNPVINLNDACKNPANQG